jgi:hypothetical protein
MCGIRLALHSFDRWGEGGAGACPYLQRRRGQRATSHRGLSCRGPWSPSRSGYDHDRSPTCEPEGISIGGRNGMPFEAQVPSGQIGSASRCVSRRRPSRRRPALSKRYRVWIVGLIRRVGRGRCWDCRGLVGWFPKRGDVCSCRKIWGMSKIEPSQRVSVE